jgi:hypothetical protein
MSEPTLILAFSELKTAVAHEMGWPKTYANLTSDQQEEVVRLIDRGYRRFLFPPCLAGELVPHEWAFLSPVTSLVIWSSITGTVSGSPSYDASAYSTVTATADKFYPTCVGQSFVFDTSGTSYEIWEYVSATQVKVVGDASGEAADDTFTITGDGDLALPDDFSDIVDDFYVISDSNVVTSLVRRGIGYINNQRAITQYSAMPRYFAIAPRAFDGTRGQRYKAMFYPKPDALKTLTYRYRILPDALTAAAPYPRGVEAHSETLRLACLAAVDERNHVDNGFEARFRDALEASIRRDRIMSMPMKLGYNGNNNCPDSDRCRSDGSTIYRNGVII